MTELKTYKLKYLENVEQRVDKFLANNVNLSRSYIQKLVKENKILVYNKPVKSNYILKFNDEILVLDDLENYRHLNVEPEDIKLDILYEDDDILIINKPSGMVVHLSNGHYKGTLVNALKFHLSKNNNLDIFENDNVRPGIVHRLDKDTTGILVIAKNDLSLQNLQKQFKNHSIVRKYYAIIHGNLSVNKLKIDLPIGRSLKDRKKNAVLENGRNAITLVQVLKSYHNFSLIECELKTGRTHQIRVHLSYLKHPLVGDKLYGYKKDKTLYDNGQYLCAYYLEFIHPKTSKKLKFEIDLPKSFNDFFKNI